MRSRAASSTEPYIDAWIRIDADGRVTVFTGKAELGQGIKTALIQVAAEELTVDPVRIAIVTADTGRTANEGYTAGSHSMQDSGTAIRHAAAQRARTAARSRGNAMGCRAGRARHLGRCRSRPDGRTLAYGALVAGTCRCTCRRPGRRACAIRLGTRVVGTPMKRVDIPAKVTGGVAYVHDLRLDGMVHGRIVRPPSPAATLRDVDDAKVKRLPGVASIVRDGNFLAVIAAREYQAVTAMRALAKAARWDEKATLPAMDGCSRR